MKNANTYRHPSLAKTDKNIGVFDYLRSKPLLSLFVAGLIIAFGILISDLPKMVFSQGWPTTNGKILYHKFVGQKFKQYGAEDYINIDVYIRYEYEVNGISYTSLSINSINTPFYPYDYASRYPVGEDVIVYYNPNHPADAMLEPGFIEVWRAFDTDSHLIFLAGIYFIFLAISRLKEIRDINRWQASM